MLLYRTGLNLKLSSTKLSLKAVGEIMYLLDLEPTGEGDGMSVGGPLLLFQPLWPNPTVIESLLDYLVFSFLPSNILVYKQFVSFISVLNKQMICKLEKSLYGR